MTAFAKIENKPACDMKAALLPVLGLCNKADDPVRPFCAALCIESDDKGLLFWTASPSAVFASKIEAGELAGDVNMTIRPSCFGLLVEHVRKAKIRFDLEAVQAAENEVPELRITTENGTLVIRDEMNPEHPDLRKILELTEDWVTTPAYFIPKNSLPFLNAFKGAQCIKILCSTSDTKSAMRVQTTHMESFIRFEALILGCDPIDFKQN